LRKEELSPKKVSAYVVQYYSVHLTRAGGDPGVLLALVSNGWRQAWEELEGSYSGFLNDVTQAWRAAEQVNQAAIGAGHPASYLGSELRCALCHASINSLVGKIPSTLLVTLVDEKKWPPAKGLADARQMPGLWQKARALAGVARHLPEPLKGNVLREAWETARAIQFFPVEAWSGFNFYYFEPFEDLPQTSELEAQEAETTIQPSRAEDYLSRFASQRSEPQYARARALANFASRPSEPLKSEALHEALEAARAVEEPYRRAEALTAVVTHWPEPLNGGVLDEALAAVWALNQHTLHVTSWTIELMSPEVMMLPAALGLAQTAAEQFSQYYRAQALAALVGYLPEPVRGEVLQEALAAARVFVHNRGFQAELLASLAPHLSEPVKGEVLSEALVAARGTLGDRQRRATALSRLAPQLAELPSASLYPLWRETLHLQTTLGRQYLLSDQRALTPVLVKLGGVEAATETVRAIQDVGQWWP
jgi:hypothetical protein